MRSLILLMLVFLLSITLIFAQEECPEIVENALHASSQHCSNLGRNVACYGNGDIQASLYGDARFAQEGDTADLIDIESLSLAAFDAEDAIWGVALLNAQADLPSTIPGQLVLMLFFGDVEVENAVAPVQEITVTANANTRLRNSPSSANDLNIIMGVSAGESLSANGRIESGEWLRVSYGDRVGWIAAVAVDGDSERMNLPVVEVGEPYLRPMQAFYLSTGIGSTTCGNVPESGVIIQIGEGVGEVELLINEVAVRFGSTLFVQAADNHLRVALLEGRANVSAQGITQFLPAGTFVDVPLAEDGRSPIEAPSFPAPYDADAISLLPVNFAATENPETSLMSPIDVAEPVPAEEVESAIVETYANNPMGLVSGWYQISVISFEQVVPNPLSNGYCASGGTVLNYVHTEFSEGFQWEIIEKESLTSFTFTNDNSAPDLGGCIVTHRGVWTANGPR